MSSQTPLSNRQGAFGPGPGSPNARPVTPVVAPARMQPPTPGGGRQQLTGSSPADTLVRQVSPGGTEKPRKRPAPLMPETRQDVNGQGSPRSPTRPRIYMGGTAGRVTAQNIFHKCCVNMCGKTCASKAEFHGAPPTWVREVNCLILRRSLIAILVGSVLQSAAYIWLNQSSLKPYFMGAAVLYALLLVVAIGVMTHRARSSTCMFETIVVILVVCAIAVCLYSFLAIEDELMRSRSLYLAMIVWKQVSLLVGSRWGTCVALLLWVTLVECYGYWEVSRTFNSELQPGDFVSAGVVSLCFAAVSWAGHSRLKDFWDIYSQLTVERKATATILSMVCDSVIWLDEDGDTVARSSQHFDYLIRQGMQGKSIGSCFDTEKDFADLRENLKRARRGPVLLTTEFRSITKRSIGVDIIVTSRSRLNGRSTGDLSGDQPSGYLLGIRSSRLSLAPQGNPTNRPMAMSEIEFDQEPASDSEGEDPAMNKKKMTGRMAKSNLAPPQPPPLFGEGAAVPLHLRCTRCKGSGVEPGMQKQMKQVGGSAPVLLQLGDAPTTPPNSAVAPSAGAVSPWELPPREIGGNEADLQRELGAQSLRGGAGQEPAAALEYHPHAVECFDMFAQTEEAMCGEWGVFYHSYSFAAMVYEINAALAFILFDFPSGVSPLPRLRISDFKETYDALSLIEACDTKFASLNARRDHHQSFRAAAIPAVCSLVSQGPGVSTPVMFLTGLSQDDISYTEPLEELLEALHFPRHRIQPLKEQLVSLAEKFNLDATMYGGQPCQSGKAGHLLQIFIRRSYLDELAFSAKPMGEVDEARQPVSWWLSSPAPTNFGQARLVAHPMRFMSSDSVRMYVASADPAFHHSRPKFQEELVHLLNGVLEEENCKLAMATALYGGPPPPALIRGLQGGNGACTIQ